MNKGVLFNGPGSIGSLVCNWMGVFSGTLTAWLKGFSFTTAGVTTSGPVPVVKVVVCGATAFPATSVTPEMASVICVLSGKGACGTSSTLLLLVLNLIESGTAGVPPPVHSLP